jgi:hypothetical protein
MEHNVSTLKTNTIQAATGTTLNIATGHKLSGAAGSIVAPGQVVQTVVSSTNTPVSIASSSFVSTNHAVTITPKFSNSKILLTVFGGHAWNGNNVNKVRVFTIYRGSTDLGHGTGGIWTHYCNAFNAQPHAGSVLDSPNTTSATTYTVYGRGQDTSSHHYAASIGGTGTNNVSTVTFTAMEIAQ